MWAVTQNTHTHWKPYQSMVKHDLGTVFFFFARKNGRQSFNEAKNSHRSSVLLPGSWRFPQSQCCHEVSGSCLCRITAVELNWCLNLSTKHRDTSLFGKEFHFVTCKDRDSFSKSFMNIQSEKKNKFFPPKKHKKAYQALWETCWPLDSQLQAVRPGNLEPLPQTILYNEKVSIKLSMFLTWREAVKSLMSTYSTSKSLPAHLPLLNKGCEHLCLHEDLQKAAQTLWRHSLAEGLAMEGQRRGGGGRGWGLFITFVSPHKERIVSDYFHKEADKSFGHHSAQRAVFWKYMYKKVEYVRFL